MMTQSATKDSSSRLQWYLDARFGMFIHWGAYTVAGAEASWPIMAPRLSEAMFDTPSLVTEKEYVKLPERFNPVNFNAEDWVRTAKEAGMKYIIITSKHHDGFCMFDAPGTSYKITNTPFKRDVCKELADACHKAGMRIGFYYSPPDMNHPGYRDTKKPSTKNWLGEPKRKEWAEYLDYMESHIRKLLTDYGDVSVIWFDGLCNHAKYDTKRFHDLIHELSPGTLINDRLGDDYDFVTPEQFIPKNGTPAKTNLPPSSDGIDSEKFFRAVITMFKIPLIRGWIRNQMHKYAEGTLELTQVLQEAYPSPDRFQPWETCMTIGSTWAYNPNETNWKSSDNLIKNLSVISGHGGNYLLNVGPTDKGGFPVEVKERLESIGEWMNANHEAIYGTTYTPLCDLEWGTATRKDNMIYLHVHDWPVDGRLTISGFPGHVLNVSLLQGDSLTFNLSGDELDITVQNTAPDRVVTIIKVEINSDSTQLSHYSEKQLTGKSIRQYIKDNAVFSAMVNGVINGLLVLFTHLKPVRIPAIDASIDILITIGIITFLTSWLVIGGTRGDIKKGKIAVEDKTKENKKPLNSGLKALLIMLLSMIVFGGVLDALVLMILPDGFSNWGYIVFKTLYTAASGAIAVILAIKSVLRER
ncbi:MAG: alpha-L-fucosidase [Clostridia bacterium]|nr:alpha-L-fucosidase [Clostridia bacterium]